ncbi:hypothetical protein [Aquimarina sp. RZ0]|uniref:hypothetical protein n=1 Tax=Aquimarina sp. RZ0 TaxID=2607730 RepID=UPI0011F3FE36|nr:hypothetical protein [Aquimarina sp. RZ0]KAA1247210.1 hypothetical protein F0000_04695 [Aquimarina sp. RZ0]
MRGFLKNVAIFLVPLVIVWGALEYFYRATESNYSYKHQKIIENYNTIETLVLGDSHALYGINPEYLDSKTFNLANVSQSIYFDELLFKKHIDSLKNLKHIIITISYFNLSQIENTKEDIWRKYFYTNQMELEVPIVSKFNIKEYSLSLTRRFHSSIEFIHYYRERGTLIGCTSDGWGNLYTESQDIDLCKNGISRAKSHEDGSQDFTENLLKIQSIIAYCKNIGCKVYLVDMPVHKCYINALNPDKWNKITTFCKNLEERAINTTYINLREDSRLEDTDLYDADHLTHKGAKKYTKIINEIISAPKNDVSCNYL